MSVNHGAESKTLPLINTDDADQEKTREAATASAAVLCEMHQGRQGASLFDTGVLSQERAQGIKAF